MLTPSPTPSLLLELRQLLETDYAVPDLWDPDKQVLLDNDAYLHAQVEAIKAGSALAPGSVTDVAIGARGILDTHSAPPSGAYDDTLTNHLRTLATRVRAIMGTASWSNALPTTLTGAKAHADATGGVHGATSAATANALVLRDASGRAKFAAPADAARKGDVDAVIANLGNHTHPTLYYTKTELAASGSYGTNPIHADRLSLGALQDARIPNLAASKIASGTFSIDRIPSLDTSKITSGAFPVERGGTGISSFTPGCYLRASSASVLEQRTPAQVRTDIGAAAASHSHAASDIPQPLYGIGTYIFARSSGGGTATPGHTYIGDVLMPANSSGSVLGTAIGYGVWRCMGNMAANTATLWVRVG